MSVSIALFLVGSDEEPQWAARCSESGIPYKVPGFEKDCCKDGHDSPEEAAAHGSTLAAIWIARQVRNLEPPAVGALALGKRAA